MRDSFGVGEDYPPNISIAFPIRSLDLFAQLISTQPTKTLNQIGMNDVLTLRPDATPPPMQNCLNLKFGLC